MMDSGPEMGAVSRHYALPHRKIARAMVFPLSLLVGCAAADTSTTEHKTVVRTHEPSTAPEAAHHRKACEEGQPAQCHAAALDAYYKPRSPETDRAAFQLFQKACAAGYAPSCNGLGVLLSEGRGIGQDLGQAAQLYHEACVAGASTGCEHLAAALSRGRGVPQDEAAANRARARAKCVFAASLADRSTADCPAAPPLPGRGP